MTCRITLTVLCLVFTSAWTAVAQQERRDKALFVEPKNEFFDSLKAASARYHKKEKQPRKEIRPDFSAIPAPSRSEFKSAWHTGPVSQAISGMCWCFATTSFFESEVYRLRKKEVKLSELYTVYWEYVEKARRFVRERGNSAFGQGSEANAVPRIWRMYGVVPQSAYSGMPPGQTVHDHDPMFTELNAYLQSVKSSGSWNEETVLATVKAIMNQRIGQPPERVTVEGKTMTPQEYLQNELKLKLDDYVDIMSLMAKPYYEKAEYEVQDNWWHSADYYNVPLDEFMSLIKKAVRAGYTLSIGGDTSEPGLEGHAGIAVVPTFDIPSAYIDENARQFRFSNGTTTDDHLIHLAGYAEKDGKDWFLIKDSGSGSRNNSHPGYYLYHEDYVKLKIMALFVHRDAAREVLGKFNR